VRLALTGFDEFKVPSSKFNPPSPSSSTEALEDGRLVGKAGETSPPASGLGGALNGKVLFFTAIQRNLAQITSVILRSRFDRE
jgi:hypothetical protein